MINFTSKPRYALDDLIRLVHALRAPGGCPWDAAQTHLSIRRNFLEEAYEACEALDCDDAAMLREELGDVLLQVLDDGRLTDGQGRTVDFKNTILIMTSNLGSQFLVNPDMDADAKKKAVMDAVHMQFKPEFINRLDELVMFHPLTREELGGIVDIQVAQVSARLTDRRITLDVTDSAREWLANTGYDPAYGARPLRRLVQTEVGDQLARMLLAGEVHDGDTVLVDQTGGDHRELSAGAADQLEDMGEEKTDDSADVPNPAE